MPLTTHLLDTSSGSVTLRWSLPASPDRVWDALTSPEALPHWMGTVTSGAFAAGSAVTVQHSGDCSCISEIRGWEPERLLAMTWEFPDEPLSVLRIELTPDGGSTQLLLVHEGLGDETANYLPGWQTHLLFLEGLLRGDPRPMSGFWLVHEGLVHEGLDTRRSPASRNT